MKSVFGPLVFYPGNVAIFLLPAFFLIRSFSRFTEIGFLVSVIIVLDSFVFLIGRERILINDIHSNVSSFLLLSLFIMGYSFIHSARTRGSNVTKPIDIAIVGVSGFGAILLFRGVNIIYRSVLNEMRSISLSGFEFHHINFGLLFLLVLTFIPWPPKGLSRSFYVTFAGFTIGMVADQVVYYCYKTVSDAAYYTWLSLVGAICTGLLYVAAMIIIQKNSERYGRPTEGVS